MPPRLADRYSMGRELGRGGMATVYLARDELLQRDVAIKLFRATAESRDQLRAQEAEAKLVASLNHYALTTLFDAGIDTTDPDHPQIYLVMEYVAGNDLREHLKKHGPLDVAQLCWLGFDLAEGMQLVHDAGFLHRDVKPANVLLAEPSSSSRRLRGKIADFGIASIIGDRDGSEATTGTAAYLSPEQVEGLDATPASDVYALGLVLLEALTGRVAFPGSVETSAFARIGRDPLIPSSVPSGVAAVLRSMTTLDPALRASLEEVSIAFQAALVDHLVSKRGLDTALLAPDEPARLAALQRYDILDTPSDTAFDQVTRIAARMLHVPIVMVSIVDVDRVWLKSRHGWDGHEFDRNTAFCSTTNPGTGPWAIPNALEDERTRNNPLVTGGPEVRSYAAAPLVTADGHHLGALCVFDRQPREFSEADLEGLRDLAGIIMRELELRLASRRAVFMRSGGDR